MASDLPQFSPLSHDGRSKRGKPGRKIQDRESQKLIHTTAEGPEMALTMGREMALD